MIVDFEHGGSGFDFDANDLRIVALAGGVGGAKLALGLQEVVAPGNLSVIVNTGDDFEHWGLSICPDLDTVTYNLAGVNNPEMGWGRADETFGALTTMSQLGAEEWFRIGDQDLALHLRRTEWLRQGVSLTEVTERLRRSLGIPSDILPMSDHPVRTLVHTEDGDMPFQHYFVRCRCEPAVIDLTFVGADQARPTHTVMEVLEEADLIVFCPSNPYLSIDPILSVPHLRRAIGNAKAPKVAVSPIVGGKAVKGPAAKMMHEMGVPINPATVAERYQDILTGFVLDQQDADWREEIEMPVLVTDTMMTSLSVKKTLASEIIAFAEQLQATRFSERFFA